MLSRRLTGFSAMCLTAMAAVAVIPTTRTAMAQDRAAEAILADLDQAVVPKFDQAKYEADKETYAREYSAKRAEVMTKRAELIGELFTTAPTNEQLVKLMPERWSTLTGMLNRGDDAGVEIEKIYAGPETNPLYKEAVFARAQATMNKSWNGSEEDKAAVMPAINAFCVKYPDDLRTPNLLASAAQNFIKDPVEAKAMWERLITAYPDNRSAMYWKGKVRQLEAVGKPFELAFTDAITGTEVSMGNLKGKIVIVDFWATWCGPCVAEMPHMKELYASFREKGVEFVGVSLDQPEDKGGLEALRKYCDEQDIRWPQYYQGNYWQSEFSSGWGINSIPTMFAVDHTGALYSVQARGQLDEMIPELIAKRDKGH